MYPLDFIALQLENASSINHQFLVNHPMIKKRYQLDIPSNDYKGRCYYGKNIDIYHDGQKLNIKCSLPYLRHGHNFTSFDQRDIEVSVKDLSEILQVDLFRATVKNREYALLSRSKLPFKNLKRLIGGVQGMELLKKTPHLLMFGNSTTICKIYEIAPNLKSKIANDVDQNFDWSNAIDVVKIELKFKNSIGNLNHYLAQEILSDRKELDSFVHNKISICPVGSSGESFSDILFSSLVNIGWSHCTYQEVYTEINRQIDLSGLTPSQKSARRKALKNKHSKVESNDYRSLMDFLEPSEDTKVISMTFPKDNSLISKF